MVDRHRDIGVCLFSSYLRGCILCYVLAIKVDRNCNNCFSLLAHKEERFTQKAVAGSENDPAETGESKAKQ